MATNYHVSPRGVDLHRDGISFQTLAQASTLLQPGDTCWMHGGTYREILRPARSGTLAAPIVYAAAVGETPVLSGCDSLSGWTIGKDSIWFAAAPEPVTQLFQQGSPLPEARFPNTGRDLYHPATIALSMTNTAATSISLTQPADTWKGATVWAMIGERWLAQTAQVTSSVPGRLTLDGNTLAENEGDGIGYVTGVLAALDTAGEWLWQADTLYMKPDSGRALSEVAIEAKTRTWAIDLSSLSNIVMQGISVFAGAANLDASKHCRLEKLSMRYLSHFIRTVTEANSSSYTRHNWTTIKYAGIGIGIFGDSNTVSDCRLEWSAGDGITLYGNHNLVQNCSIQHLNYSGADGNGISIHGAGHRVTRNTVDSCGRGCIFLGPGTTKTRIDHNHVFNSGLLNWDVGGIYSYGNDGDGSIIDHNWVHDSHSKDGYALGTGIYVDNFCSNLQVHHNVVWNCDYNAMNYSRPAVNILWANNTMFGAKNVTFSYLHTDATVDSSRDNRLWNNLMTMAYATSPTFRALNQSHNVRLAELPLRNPAEFDFRLTAGSIAIDSGLVIAGITDNYSGRAPDVGAYESGGIWWKAGAHSTDDSTTVSVNPLQALGATNAWHVKGERIIATRPCNVALWTTTGRLIQTIQLDLNASFDLSKTAHGLVVLRDGFTTKTAVVP